jgi:transcriptional regulator with XRE-family HTH domain
MNTTFKSDIALRIRELREDLALSQEAFGQQMEFSQGLVSDVEAGKKPPSDKLIRAICRHYRVSERWLRDGVGQPQPQPASMADSGRTEETKPSAPPAEPGDMGMPRAVAMLAAIYDSGDETLVRAINSNLAAFAVAGERKRQIAQLGARVAALEEALESVTRQLVSLGGRAAGDHANDDGVPSPRTGGGGGQARRAGES